MVDAYLLVLRLKHDLQTWGSSTHWGLVYMSPSAIKKNIHHTGSSPVLTTKMLMETSKSAMLAAQQVKRVLVAK
jgi:hypothetical protein